MLPHLLDASIRAMALAAVAGLLLAAIRRRSAAFKHAIWTAVLMGMLTFAIPQVYSPAIPVRVSQTIAAVMAPPAPRHIATLVVTPDDSALVKARPRPVGWKPILLSIWCTGALLMLARVMLGVVLTRRSVRTARPILGEPAIRSALQRGTDLIVTVEESEHVTVPLTVGWPDPRIILPTGWRSWPLEKVNVALAHELAHVERCDALVALLTAINKAVFWFHPLAWWLARKLPELAEFAADEEALAVAADSRQYARMLVEIALDARAGDGRLLWNGVAMNGFGRISRRVDRILDGRACLRSSGWRKGMRNVFWSSAVLVICVTAAVQFQPALRAQQDLSEAQQRRIRFTPGYQWMFLPPNDPVARPGGFSAQEVGAWENQLAANPEDEKVRLKLAVYYNQNKIGDRRIALVYWLIEHHPESFLHTYLALVVNPARDGNAAYEGAHARWGQQMAMHPTDVYVLLNAAKSAGEADMTEEISLLKKGQPLDRDGFTGMIAQLYSRALSTDHGKAPNFNATVRRDLDSSSDALLLGKTGALLVEAGVQNAMLNRQDYDIATVRSTAINLLARAQSLDPQNQDWANAMEGARQLETSIGPEPGAPVAQVEAGSGPVPRIRVGGGVMAANLLYSVRPEYPEAARREGIEGTVKLQVQIAPDGVVSDVRLITGPSALVEAATAAVRQYVYKPTLLEGKQVEVQTTVDVSFQK